jgi:N-acetylglucosaminyl-diphospho-decaprenol L-rhamnosyltransferase
MGPGMDLSVVVVSYNTRELVSECLASVFSTLGPRLRHEVIVVDNASSDDSVAMIRDSFPQVRVLANSENVGFAAGSNQGLKESNGRFVILLNPDTVASAGALERMVALMEEQGDVGVVGPRLIYPDGQFQHSAFTFPTLPMIFLDFFPLHHRLVNSRLNGRYPRALYEKGKPFAIDHPLGAALMVRRPVMEQVGLLDPGFFMYCEEIDWCMRIKRAGWRILCCPRAEIVHYAAQSTSQFADDMYVELHRSRYRLYEKHYSPSFRRVARWLVGLGIAYMSLRARWAHFRGELTAEALDRRLRAYREVRSLA